VHAEQTHLLKSSHAFAPPKCGWKDQFRSLLSGLLIPLSLVLHWLFKGDAGGVAVTAVTTLSLLSHRYQCYNSACYSACLNPFGLLLVPSSLGRAFCEDLQSHFAARLHIAFQIPLVILTCFVGGD